MRAHSLLFSGGYKSWELEPCNDACSPKMRNKERGLHPCRPRSRYLRQKGGKGFDFVLKKFKIINLGDIAWWSD